MLRYDIPVGEDALLQCSQPKGKPLFILAITSGGTHEPLRPDYRLTTFQVYTNLAIFLMLRYSSLDTLGSCSMKENLPGLPSWVPKWALIELPLPLKRREGETQKRVYQTSIKSKAHIRVSSDRLKLYLQGFVIDDISLTTPTRTPNLLDETELIEELKRKNNRYLDVPYMTGGKMGSLLFYY